ncbi:MAG: RIP metalloprotease RseP [Rhodospirillales bacterium]|nr:RIP metalloprotease RseP [Rhodospirillales bacterium]
MHSIFDMFHLVAQNIWLYGGAFVLILSLLVFIHEWGHYIVARMCGVQIESFSIGFGKEIFGVTDKHGTRWKLSLVPLGGYVKMFGDVDPSSAGHTDNVEDKDTKEVRPMTAAEQNRAFFAKPVGQRAAIAVAGPAINYIFAIIVLAGLYMFYGQPVTPPMASAIVGGSAAERAGFQPHDEVLTIDGVKISSFEEIRRKVLIALDTPMDFKILRDGKEATINVAPDRLQEEDRFGFKQSRGLLGLIGPGNAIDVSYIVSVDGQPVEGAEAARAALMKHMDEQVQVELDRGPMVDRLVIQPLSTLNEAFLNDADESNHLLVIVNSEEEVLVQHNLFTAPIAAVQETWSITTSTLEALGQMFTGTRSATELGGIIRIGAMAGDMAQAGFLAFITFAALLSINLGLINLFPIPMLDGGHLLFYAIEAVKGSPISEQVQEYAFRLGLFILVGIMLFANVNDLVQIFM